MRLTFDTGIPHDDLPLFICFAAFVVTFVVTRVITRMIRAGKGPFRDNVSAGGLHVHHAVPGIVLLVIGAFLAVGSRSQGWEIVAALLVGTGTSLVLDEFALILHLEDVYWADEGRISVEMVSLAIGCLGLAVLGVRPFDLRGIASNVVGVGTVAVVVVTQISVCVAKGKYRLALFGCFLPLVGLIGAIRLARPRSRWARRRYGPEKLARAETRARRHDARWGRTARWVGDFVAGSPSTPGAAGAPDA